LLFGGFVSISTTAWLALRLHQAVTSLKKGSKKSALYVYLGAFEKFILAIVLFGVGIVLLKMHPLPMMAGLVAGQIGFSIGSYKLN
jgi:cell division protein FtsX